MTGWIIVGCILLFFVFLFSLKATVTVAYHEEVTLSVKVLFLNLRILPKKEKKGPRSMSARKAERIRLKAAKKAKKKQEAAAAKKAKKAEHKVGQATKKKKSVREILDIISLVRQLVAIVVRRFFKHLRIKVARLKVRIATGDAATTAVAYGAVTQSINLLLPILEEVKNFNLPKTTDLDVQADFLGETSEIDVELSFSLRVWHVLDVGFGALKTFLKHQFKKMAD